MKKLLVLALLLLASVSLKAQCAFTTTALSNGTVGTPYTGAIAFTGCPSNASLVRTLGYWPLGLVISSGGQISGTPALSGKYYFQMKLQWKSSGTSFSTMQDFWLTVVDQSTPIPPQPPIGTTGTPLDGGHWPSVISYASGNEIAPAMTTDQVAFDLSKLDAAHGADFVPILVQNSATFYPVKYDVIQAIGTDSSVVPPNGNFDSNADVLSAEAYFTSKGWNPETLWLHYSDDTVAKDRSGNTWNVKGYPNGTATSLQQARVRSSGGYIFNHQLANVKTYLNSRYVASISQIEPVSGRRLYRGVFIDSMGDMTDLSTNGVVEIPATISGGHIAEYGNQTIETIAPTGTYANAVIAAISSVTTAMHTAHSDALLLLNNAGCLSANCLKSTQAADGYLSEWFDYENPNGGQQGTRYQLDFAKQVTDSKKIFVWSEATNQATVPSLPNFAACNYATPLARHQMYVLSDYWMAKSPDNYMWFEERPIYEQLNLFWLPAQERNVGKPTGTYVVWQSGTDASGSPFVVLKRTYDSGMVVLSRTHNGYPTPSDYGTKSPMYDLGGTYHVLYPDNTLGPAITQIGLCHGEAVTLVP